MIEIFKDIKGYYGLYQISNLGRVKSLNYKRTGKERILKPQKVKNNYLQVLLCKQGKVKRHYVHRLVSQAFLPNPQNLPEINHKDENPLNNVISNLEWCTRLYNMNYGTRNQRSAESNANSPKRCKQVMCLETGIIYSSVKEAKHKTRLHSISAVCRGERKTCGGFHWKYVN